MHKLVAKLFIPNPENKPIVNHKNGIKHVNEINNLHQLAMSAAKDAVTYAKKIGTLLLESKSEIPHGKFIKWIEENTSISPRQAQRYMRVASGKDLKISDFSNKNDKMSYLTCTKTGNK